MALEVGPGGVATLRIEGAKKLNILNGDACDRAVAEIHAARERGDVRVLIARAPQDDAFIGGADIAEMAALDEAGARRFINRLRGLCEALRSFPAPVIARCAGWCLGGGLEVALACDIRLSEAQAMFGMPETKVGIPSVIHAALLPSLIGMSRTQWLLLTGENVNATTAEHWGLVHAVHDDGAALDAAIARQAASFAAMGQGVLRQQKRMLRKWEACTVDAAIEASVDEFAAAYATGEPQRHMGAFLSRKR